MNEDPRNNPRNPVPAGTVAGGGTAGVAAAPVAQEPVPGGSGEARLPLAVRDDGDERYRELEEKLIELEYLFGLLLEFSHDMMNDIHAPKARWERQMLPVWKAHIAKKRGFSQK